MFQENNASGNVPFVNAFAILETACPTAAAYSGESSDIFEQCVLGITNVCPLLRGIISWENDTRHEFRAAPKIWWQD